MSMVMVQVITIIIYFQYFHLVRYVLVEPAVQEGVDTGGAHGGEVDAEEGEEVKPESVDVSEEIQPDCGQVSVDERLSNSGQGEEIKVHRASIL